MIGFFLEDLTQILKLKLLSVGSCVETQIYYKEDLEELRGVKYQELNPIKKQRFGQGASSILVADLDRQPIDLKDQSGRFDKTC